LPTGFAIRESNIMKDTVMAMMTVAWPAAAAWGAGLKPGDVNRMSLSSRSR
jgi:hypothetical protein